MNDRWLDTDYSIRGDTNWMDSEMVGQTER